MLDQIYYNNTLQNWLISGGIISFALIINWIITLLNRRYLKALAKRTKNQVDNILVNTLETPLKVGIVLIAIWTALNRLELSKSFDEALYKTYEILTVLNITWFVAHLASRLIREYFIKKSEQEKDIRQKIHFDSHLTSLIRKTAVFGIWTVGTVTALNNVGLDLKAILGTLGIGGIAIALAAQDTVKNIFGGFTILMDGTFRIGDRVKIGEFDGIVEDIGIRSTKIRNFDKRLITLPNYKIMDNAVMNVSAAPQLRVVSNLGLTYDTTPELMQKALEILNNIALKNEAVSKEGISAVFESFGEFSLNIRYCYFVIDTGDTFDTPSAINFEILKKFNEAGIKFAFPTQTLHVEKNTVNTL